MWIPSMIQVLIFQKCSSKKKLGLTDYFLQWAKEESGPAARPLTVAAAVEKRSQVFSNKTKWHSKEIKNKIGRKNPCKSR